MKQVMLIGACIVGLFSTNLYASKYCDGYRAGYETGFKQATGRKPARPFCPAAPFKTTKDPKDDYDFGYLNGFELGKEKGNK